MKEFIKNFIIISVVVAAFLFVTFRNIETVWKPIYKTDGSGTQAVGESDLVLPGGGEGMATVQSIPAYDMTVESDMTDAEKLTLIDSFLEDAFEYYWDLDDAQVWKGVAIVISDIINFGGAMLG